MSLSHTDKVLSELAEKTMCILLLRGENTEKEPIWAYVGVRADKLEEFMAAQQTEVFHPEDFGVIIESGSGEPSDEIKAKMTNEYGFNHNSMIDIPNAEKAGKLKSDLLKAAKKQD